jgi:dihydroxy-acid dehydratase
VKDGIRAAGGTPIEFNTIVVTDGITMGTPGMRASLMSRETITDSIELAVGGHSLDALVVLVGCDKTIPAAAMAAARLNIPAVILYGGSIGKGRYSGRDLSIQDVFEAVGAHAAGHIDEQELDAIEKAACPGAGACGGQFTANTMSMSMTMLGLSPMGSNDVPAVHPDKDSVAFKAGQQVMAALEAGRTPDQLINTGSLRNAAAAVCATAGSTNAVLHLLAIAQEAGVDFELSARARRPTGHSRAGGPDQAARRIRHPVWKPVSGRVRGQAGRARPAVLQRTGARVRLRRRDFCSRSGWQGQSG